MKKAVLIIALAFSGAAVGAEQQGENQNDFCGNIYGIAKCTMELRQLGESMPNQMKDAKGSKVLEAMVIEAYESPRFSTEKNQKREVDEFADKWYLTCVKETRK